MAVVIDRRLNPKDKNLGNRKRFINRSKEYIKEQVRRKITEDGIKKVGEAPSDGVSIKSKDVREPTFRDDPRSGKHRRVLPGNKEYDEGDIVPKPFDEDDSGGSKPGEGDSVDEFRFILTKDEFLYYLFEELELPDFIKESLKQAKMTDTIRAGLTNSGSPANLNLGRTLRKSLGRRISLHRPTDEEITELEEEIENDKLSGLVDMQKLQLLEDLKSRQKRVPFIDDNDLRYNLWKQEPKPLSQAVMFCMMDVSGSMGEREKDIAKRFFLILYLFLEKKYENIDIRFVRHTDKAEEVDEHTFFYDIASGGTKISSGLIKIDEIIKTEYPLDQWNIYVAQCTDGDNIDNDNSTCREILEKNILPASQYFIYVQVRPTNQMVNPFGFLIPTAWATYKALEKTHENLICSEITQASSVWTAFRKIFTK